MRCPNFATQEKIEFRKDAQKFEAGSYNYLGLVGLNAAMELLLEIGVEAIAAELLRKRELLVPAIAAKGYEVAGINPPGQLGSGIVSFSHEDATVIPALHKKLDDAGISTSLRADRQGKRHLRLSPHFYNTDAELHKVLEMV